MFINKPLFRIARECKLSIIIPCVLEILFVGLSTCISLLTAFLIQSLRTAGQTDWALSFGEIVALIFALTALRAFVVKCKTIAAERCGAELKNTLRAAMIRKLFSLGPAYTTRERTGNIGSMLTSKVEWLKNYYTVYVPTAISAVINSVVTIAIVFLFDVKTSIVCTSACIGLFLCPMLFHKVMQSRGEAEWSANASYYSDCLDSIQGLTTLKAFNADELQREKMHYAGENLRKKVMQLLKITMIENGVIEALIQIGNAVSVLIAVLAFSQGRMEARQLVYVLFLITACFYPMRSLSNAWHLGYKGITAAEGIYNYIHMEPVQGLNASDTYEPSLGNQNADEVVFDHVTFGYNREDGLVLNDVSFRIPSGQSLALVGSSGSGKSTIARLLYGFYEADSGTIQVGGKALKAENIATIRNQLSAVWQDAHIFYGTVAENIEIGRPNSTHEDVIQAAKRAGIHDTIMNLPEQYQTILGEQGMRLSGGERQRIALARAFLRDAPILILDEATSSLDRKQEIDIQNSFQAIAKDKTVLIIAHRLETILSADQVCLLEGGRIIGLGSHSALLSSSAAYRKLIGYQMKV